MVAQAVLWHLKDLFAYGLAEFGVLAGFGDFNLWNTDEIKIHVWGFFSETDLLNAQNLIE